MMDGVGRSSIYFLILFLFTPALLSYNNVKSSLDHHDICLVDPGKNTFEKSNPSLVLQENIQELFGVYRVFQGSNYYLPKSSLYTSNACIFSDFQKCGWPSSSTIASLLSPRVVTMNSDQHHTSPTTRNQLKVAASIHWDRGHIPLIPGQNQWCLILQLLPDKAGITQKFTQICSPEVTSIMANPNQEPYFPELPLSPPPDGFWGNDHFVQVHCYIGHWNNQGIRSKNTEKVNWNAKNIPSTMLIIAIQIVSFCMAQSKSNPEERRRSYGISYQNLVIDGELWRIYKSALSHADIGHLLLNLHHFYVIGACLEEEYGSVPFLNMNILLIFFSAICTVMVSSSSIPTIMNPKHKIILLGYSPVIFAWSTIMCLQRQDYPILPWSSFPTYGHLNVLPFVYLGLTMIFYPQESSLLSNVTGLKLGLLIHMNLADNIFLVPHVLVPMIYLIDFYFIRKTVPLHKSVNDQSYVIVARDDNLENPSIDTSTNSFTSFSSQQQKFLHVLESTMIGISVMSIFALDHAMGISQCFVTYLFYLSVNSYRLNLSGKSSFMKAYMISVAIFITTDSMSLGSWIIYKSFVRTEPSILLSLEQSLMLFALRWITNACGLVIVSSLLHQDHDFEDLPKIIFDRTKKVGDWVLTLEIPKIRLYRKALAENGTEEEPIEFSN